MNYKTTYFTISLNPEISVREKEYNERIDIEKLKSEVKDLEPNFYRFFEMSKDFIETPDFELESWHDIVDSFDNDHIKDRAFNEFKKNVLPYLEKRKTLRDSENQRFTNDHTLELNKHLNEMADDGWKLFSMTPITKGYKDWYSGTESGLGYAHDVVEGFVLVWERNDG